MSCFVWCDGVGCLILEYVCGALPHTPPKGCALWNPFDWALGLLPDFSYCIIALGASVHLGFIFQVKASRAMAMRVLPRTA
jgi:hypothetical protein